MHRFALGSYRKQSRVCWQLHRRGRIFANVKGKVVKPVTLILGRFSIDLGSYFKDMQYTLNASIQGEGVLARASLIRGLGTMQT